MKLKLVAIAGIIGVGTYLYLKLKYYLTTNGSLVLYRPGQKFYVLGVYPFDDSFSEDLEDLGAGLQSMIDSYLYDIEQEEIAKLERLLEDD